MSTSPMIDAERLSLIMMRNELRLPAVKHMWGDFAQISRDQAEASVLFELINANQPVGEWNRTFPGPAMTLLRLTA